jgi:hypothetical protein
MILSSLRLERRVLYTRLCVLLVLSTLGLELDPC